MVIGQQMCSKVMQVSEMIKVKLQAQLMIKNPFFQNSVTWQV